MLTKAMANTLLENHADLNKAYCNLQKELMAALYPVYKASIKILTLITGK